MLTFLNCSIGHPRDKSSMIVGGRGAVAFAASAPMASPPRRVLTRGGSGSFTRDGGVSSLIL